MDYTAYGILQARTLEWVAFPFSRGSECGREVSLLHAQEVWKQAQKQWCYAWSYGAVQAPVL